MRAVENGVPSFRALQHAWRCNLMSQLLPKQCANNVKKAAARDECAAAAEAADRAAVIELLADLAVEEQQQETLHRWS